MSFFKEEGIISSIKYFVFTRFILVLIGYLTIHEFKLHFVEKDPNLIFHSNDLLSLWGNFDTGWYLKIAREWYPVFNVASANATFEQYSFFPLYPALMRIFYLALNVDPFITGLIISNLSLLIAGLFLFRIVKLFYDDQVAKISVACVYLFPVSFIFSGVFTESLYMALLLGCFYYSLKEKWLIAGVLGFFLSSCRPIGVFIFIPLLFNYLKNINFKLSAIKPDFLILFLIPAGILPFMVQNYLITGDPLMFAHNPAWSGYLKNPFQNLWEGLTNSFFTLRFLAYYTLGFLIIWIISFRHLSVAMNIIIFYSVFIPLSYGLMSMPRMILAAFPFFVMMGSIAVKYRIQLPLLILLTFIQCYLAVCWFLGFGNVV